MKGLQKKEKLARCIDLTVRVPAHHLGSILIELEGRVVVLGIGVVQDVPFHKNKPRKEKPEKKLRKWTPAQRKAQAKRMRRVNKIRHAATKEGD